MKQFIIALLVLFSATANAQSDCNCQKNFDEIYQKVRDNYGAFSMKVNATTKPAFDALSKKVKEKSAGVTDPTACYFILKEWTEFFKDGHLFINTINPIVPAEPADALLKRAAAVPVQKFNSEASFQAYLNANLAKLAYLEGIWESDDKAYRLGIVKDAAVATKFYGFLLNKKDDKWVAGKTKFVLEQLSETKLKTTYYYADFTSELTLTTVVKNLLVMENIYKFNKVSPIPKEYASQDDLIHRVPDYRVEKLDSLNTLVRLPPFTMSNVQLFVKEMLSQNNSLLRSSKNLIIDLRNNPGGDEAVFDPVFEYIANGPIVRRGSKVRASMENQILLNHELKAIQDFPEFAQSLDPKLRDMIRKMQQNPGTIITAEDKTFNFPKSSLNPQKVVILVDKNTSSTAESLSLEAKQSSKTIIMGTNTKGAFDYTEVRDWGLPCYAWRLALPLGYSYRLPLTPLEGVGIKPDVRIPDTEADWVGFAVKYLSTVK
ncbi:S41 family peptidase [Lacihabitans soyangensis]|jgi:hypothetical protein|uniref:Tail specific protease domain-containing protein n=3 Tax=Lacihabitans soyangensis TaxID=869394 RepID=A0AAE3H333_9BACT|nr:S41 family peptidase [Lacihabitans soyangensis]MCP9764209.1 hypothetical protein [Lacihabitans soyangensis]